MPQTVGGKGLGWRRDFPDYRDFTPEGLEPPAQPAIAANRAARVRQVRRGGGQEERAESVLARVGIKLSKELETLGPEADLRADCSPIEDQGDLGSCTANAGVGLVEYFERKAFGRHLDASRLFLYKATRNLMHETGDTGAYLRLTMKALVLFGVPPEEYWPYRIQDFDDEPPAFGYAFAQNYEAIRYYRLDPPGTPKPELLARIKANIAAKLPSMFGFTVFDSIDQASGTGEIPFPSAGDRVAGGHAVVAVGYRDDKAIGPSTGALLIRNSWGTDWGDDGYGWLPYDYVLSGLAVDWWSLAKSEWLDSEAFDF